MSEMLNHHQRSSIIPPEEYRELFESAVFQNEFGEGGVIDLATFSETRIKKLATRFRIDAGEEAEGEEDFNARIDDKFESLLLLLQREAISGATDSLTGLFNKKTLYGRVNSELARMKRTLKAGYELRDVDSAALMIIDLDKFKPINDTYGHVAGDKVLQKVSEKLKEILRENDMAARVGGDEFALFLTGVNEEQALEARARIEQSINELSIDIQHEGKTVTIPIGASVGVTALKPNQTAEEIDELADQSMYEVKKAKNVQRKPA